MYVWDIDKIAEALDENVQTENGIWVEPFSPKG